MGNRKYYDQIIIDACQYEKDKITDEMDVSTMKDFMQVGRWPQTLYKDPQGFKLTTFRRKYAVFNCLVF